MLPQFLALEVSVADKQQGTHETDRNRRLKADKPVCSMVEGSVVEGRETRNSPSPGP